MQLHYQHAPLSFDTAGAPCWPTRRIRPRTSLRLGNLANSPNGFNGDDTWSFRPAQPNIVCVTSLLNARACLTPFAGARCSPALETCVASTHFPRNSERRPNGASFFHALCSPIFDTGRKRQLDGWKGHGLAARRKSAPKTRAFGTDHMIHCANARR